MAFDAMFGGSPVHISQLVDAATSGRLAIVNVDKRQPRFFTKIEFDTKTLREITGERLGDDQVWSDIAELIEKGKLAVVKFPKKDANG